MTHDWEGLVPPEEFPYPALEFEVQGPYALFTRPELASERLSYPVITPTAAIGLASSVFWKPEFQWVVEKIEVLSELRWATLRRNEAEGAITAAALERGYLDLDGAVQQRMTTMLCDVHYRVSIQPWVHPEVDEDPAKFRDQFLRRVQRGQSFRPPFLGAKEMHADVTPTSSDPPIDWTEDLGVMLHSIHYLANGKETYEWFVAQIDQGVMSVPRRGIMAGDSDAA